MNHAPIALTCGEPAGVGLELAEQAWSELRDTCAFFLLGDPAHLPGTVPFKEINTPDQALTVCREALPVLPQSFDGKAQPGKPDARNAKAVVDVIAKAVDFCASGQASAICTAPIHKKALKDGTDFPWPGHTEYLAHLAKRENVVMMLASDALRVVPTTIHIALKDVPAALTPDLLEQTIRITQADLQHSFGLENPRLAVAGLNPHAGEGGEMGWEDARIIAPVLEKLRQEGMRISGPHSADTMFHAKARQTYDAAICMYHDQALIPIKTLDFDRGVNVTLGLPFIRTSPDHGTAFDIAGTGTANPSSLIEALRLAQKMAEARRAKASQIGN
ncbi:4-hydroxythreonine-4-phosphate dehydrogenase PdxA [Cognatishimia sp. WU-CL00825]|uniref:4-hydroxythreonine-4-phosphate dehydrogenase PdxA n=1 Tax=Cognatishimia sp. WU-CL00825 TaxID=3127658 RepID=UPI00310AAA79